MATASRSKTKPVADDVLAVLRGATCEGNHLKLNCGDLSPDLYKRVNAVLVAMGGKWKGGKTTAHVFDRDPAPLLAGMLGAGAVTMPAKNPLDFFPTPEAVARLMLDRAEIPRGIGPAVHVLEPSAGEGAIADFVCENRRGVLFTCVELDPIRAERIEGRAHKVVNGDFLNVSGHPAKSDFDFVLMNPPFTSADNATVYVDHVLHAFAFLRPGGRLVAVCPAGFTFSQNRKLTTFRDWVEEHGDWDPLPADAFKGSGTGVNACLVVVDKPRGRQR